MTEFEALYQKYAHDVFRFAYFLSGNRADAEDIASETFVRAWSAPGGIRQTTVKAFLLVIARNCYLQGLRRSGRHSPIDEDFADPIDSGQAPYEWAEWRGELTRVMKDLQQLPEMDRTALLMSAAEEMSYEQIAATLGLTLGAVKTKIHRARLKLEQMRKDRR